MTRTVMNVRDYLLAGKDPSRIALRFPHMCHSYGALTTHADYVAAYLLRRGVRKGDRVLRHRGQLILLGRLLLGNYAGGVGLRADRGK